MTQQSNDPAPPPANSAQYGMPMPSAPAPEPQQGTAPAALNPFAGIPVRDYIVDAVAALLLIISLFVPWTLNFATSDNNNAAGHVAVLLITIVSLLSLGLTYLWRSGVFGPSWNYVKMQDLRAAANVPYVVLFLVYLVIAIAKDGVMYQAGAFGLAGAILAAQPRKSELGTRPETVARSRRWTYVLWGTAGLTVIVAFIQLVKTLIDFSDGSGAWWLIAAIIGGVLTPVLLIFTAKRIQGGSQAYRLAAIGIGIAGAFLAFISLNDGPQALVAIAGSFIHFTPFVWMAFGAVAISPTLDALMTPTSAGEKWRQTHHAVLSLTLPIAAVAIILSVANIIQYHDSYSGEETALFVMTLIFSVILGAGVIVVRQAFAGNTAQGFILSSVYSGIVFVLFLVLVIMAASNESWGGWLNGLLLLITFVIPSALLALLWMPASSRAEYASLKGAPGVHSGFSFDGAPAASSAPAPAPERTPVELLAEASNPGTPAGRLHELAVNHPHTHDAIVTNPSSYEELRQWILQVQAAKAKTAHTETPSEESSALTDPTRTQESADTPPQSSAREAIAEGAAPTQETAERSDSQSSIAATTAAESPRPQAAQSVSELTQEESENEKAEPEMVPNPYAAEARNPNTTGTRLQELAGSYPELHHEILANPSTYEGLRTWILTQLSGTPATSVDPLLAEASDPATSGARLQELAATHQNLHAAIAANPAAYPQLITWLAQVNAPGVAEALSRR